MKLAKFKMLRLLPDHFSTTCKLNLEKRADKRPKRFLLRLKTQLDKKTLSETTSSRESKLRVKPNNPSLLPSKDLLFRDKKLTFTKRDSRLKERELKLRT